MTIKEAIKAGKDWNEFCDAKSLGGEYLSMAALPGSLQLQLSVAAGEATRLLDNLSKGGDTLADEDGIVWHYKYASRYFFDGKELSEEEWKGLPCTQKCKGIMLSNETWE